MCIRDRYDIGMGYLGNGLTVWNRAVEVNGDYQNIAHISPEGEITFYVQDLPQRVVAVSYTHLYKNDINGTIIAINPAVLKPEYQRADRQLYYVTGGFRCV